MVWKLFSIFCDYSLAVNSFYNGMLHDQQQLMTCTMISMEARVVKHVGGSKINIVSNIPLLL